MGSVGMDQVGSYEMPEPLRGGDTTRGLREPRIELLPKRE